MAGRRQEPVKPKHAHILRPQEIGPVKVRQSPFQINSKTHFCPREGTIIESPHFDEMYVSVSRMQYIVELLHNLQKFANPLGLTQKLSIDLDKERFESQRALRQCHKEPS